MLVSRSRPSVYAAQGCFFVCCCLFVCVFLWFCSQALKVLKQKHIWNVLRSTFWLICHSTAASGAFSFNHFWDIADIPEKKKKKEEKSWKVTFSVFTHCLSSNGPGNYLVRFAWNLWKAKKRQEKAEMKMRSERLKVNWLSEETNQSKTGKGGTGCWNSTGESYI